MKFIYYDEETHNEGFEHHTKLCFKCAVKRADTAEAITPTIASDRDFYSLKCDRCKKDIF